MKRKTRDLIIVILLGVIAVGTTIVAINSFRTIVNEIIIVETHEKDNH